MRFFLLTAEGAEGTEEERREKSSMQVHCPQSWQKIESAFIIK
jgi:hypothetical protein